MGVSRFTRSAASRSSSISANTSCFGCFIGCQPVSAFVKKHTRPLVFDIGKRRAQGLEQQTQLEMGNDKRCGQNLETENAFQRRTLEIVTDERVAAFVSQRLGDLAQRFDEVGTGAAAWIENVHVGVGESVGYAESIAELGVDAGDHVLNDLDRCVPDAQVLTSSGSKASRNGS